MFMIQRECASLERVRHRDFSLKRWRISMSGAVLVYLVAGVGTLKPTKKKKQSNSYKMELVLLSSHLRTVPKHLTN